MSEESKRGLTHWYVERWVRAFEKIPGWKEKKVPAPEWWAKLMKYPDSSYKEGKSLAYRAGHAAAIGVPAAIGGAGAWFIF